MTFDLAAPPFDGGMLEFFHTLERLKVYNIFSLTPSQYTDNLLL